MSSSRKKRVLLAKPGLDGHDLGIKFVARALRNAGMEVVYTGLNVTPEEAVSIAIQESVDAIGVSYLSGSHLMLTEKIIKKLKEREAGHLKLVIGGIIPEEDIQKLKQMGAAEIFRPGTPVKEIVDSINRLVS
ncbi:MAG: cobalamin B12-binding domain-containing protein [Pseudomonadota bacterium]